MDGPCGRESPVRCSGIGDEGGWKIAILEPGKVVGKCDRRGLHIHGNMEEEGRDNT